jgi:hypothetical protein
MSQREDAVDESIARLNEIYSEVSEGYAKFRKEEFGKVKYANRFKAFFNTYPNLRKFSSKNSLEDLNKLKTAYKVRLDNLTKVRTADKRGYLEWLTLVENPEDGLLDVEVSKPGAAAQLNKAKFNKAKFNKANIKILNNNSNTSRPSSPEPDRETLTIKVPEENVNPEPTELSPQGLPSGWYEAKNDLGRTYFYTAGGKASWNRPSQTAAKTMALTKVGGTRKRSKKTKAKAKRTRRH